jgi:hypothetical protein
MIGDATRVDASKLRRLHRDAEATEAHEIRRCAVDVFSSVDERSDTMSKKVTSREVHADEGIECAACLRRFAALRRVDRRDF